MSTIEEREQLQGHLEAVKQAGVTDLPHEGYLNLVACPLCHTPILKDLTYQELDKVQHWTVAQLIAWHNLMKDSGLTQSEALERTAEQARPGIGALYNPTVLGVNLHGIFVGIEPDGYTHS